MFIVMNPVKSPALSLSLVAALAGSAVGQITLHHEPFDDSSTSWTLDQGDVEITAALPSQIVGHPSGGAALRLYDPSLTTYSAGSTGAVSPPVNLSDADDPWLTFWMTWAHELDCGWDQSVLSIHSASTGQVLHQECLSTNDSPTRGRWSLVERELDPGWGVVRIRLSFETFDFNYPAQWIIYDELRVFDAADGTTSICAPLPRADGAAGPRLSSTGDVTSASSDLRIHGSGFVPFTFSAGFIGPATAILPAGRGLRCIAGGGTSRRLAVAPTRAAGTPVWSLDPNEPSYGWMFGPGASVFVQTYYRDGGSFNFSEALRLKVTD